MGRSHIVGGPHAARTLAAALTVGLLSAAALSPAPVAASESPPTVVLKQKKQRFVRVKRIRPRGGARGVNPEDPIKIRFSKPVDPLSVNQQTVQVAVRGGDDVVYTFELLKKDRLLVLHPLVPLDPGRSYEVRVRVGIRSNKGRELKFEKQTVFTTDPEYVRSVYLTPDQFVDVANTMFDGRADHSATRLASGDVLLAGGQTDFVTVTSSANIFEPGEDVFRPVLSTLVRARHAHAAARLGSGAILVGGYDGTDAMSTTEVYDNSFGVFLEGPEMEEKRDFVAAIEIGQDEGVLVAGGLSYSGASAGYSKTAELLVGAAGWRRTRGDMVLRRAGHTLTTLADGRILVCGGQPAGSQFAPAAEIYDPSTERFTETAFKPSARRQGHTATLLLNSGWVLIADGGTAQLELFDPATERFFSAGGSSFARRTSATASRLPGDRVLIAGGFDSPSSSTTILASMDLFLPSFGGGGLGAVVRGETVFESPRAGHTATELDDGRILFAGGYGSVSDESLATGVLFSPTR